MKFPILYYAKDDENTISILLNFIDICNYSCEYCCNIFPRSKALCNSHIIFEFIKDFSLKTNKHIILTIAGGEPTLHPDLLQFCSKLQNSVKNIDIEVLTNLSNTLDYYSNLLKLGVKIAASWHGTNDKHNIEFAKKIYKLPKRYFDANQIEIRIMFEYDNWNNSVQIFKLLLNKFRQYIEISLLLDQNGKLQNYSNDEIKQYYDFVKLLPFTNSDLYIRYNDNSESKLSYNGIFLNDSISFNGWHCNAGIDHFYIHVNGDIYNCERYYEQKKKPLCNLIETNGKYISSLFKTCICCSDYCTCNLTIQKKKL